MPSSHGRSPIRQGLRAALWVGIFGIVLRFASGLIDPQLQTWAIVAIAPLFGLAGYIRATGRNPFPPELMVAIGYAGVLVYARVIVRDGLPGSLVEWIAWSAIVALPVALMVWGSSQIWRQESLRTAKAVTPVG